MESSAFSRTRMLMSDDAYSRISRAHVAVFGIGGVGGHAAEALVRAGIGELTFIDHDVVSSSNINRQIIALNSTVGKLKAEAMRERALDINPNAVIHALPIRYCAESRDDIFSANFDYIIDAIDLITHKIDLICTAKQRNIPIISAMGTGNKLDPSGFFVTDLAKTQNCPLARIMRKELKKRGITHHTVVFSEEMPLAPSYQPESANGRRSTPGSVSWVPGCAGMIMAGEAIRQIARI